MPDEGGQQVRSTVDSLQLLDQCRPQFERIFGSEVGEAAMLGMLPDHLVGIGLGCIAGELLGDDFGVIRQVGPDNFRAVVDVATIPENRHRPGDVSSQLFQERHDILTMDVLIVGHQVKIQSEPFSLGAHGHDADGRDPVVPIPALENRRLSSRGESATDRGREHEARLVEKDQVSLPPSSLADHLAKFLNPSSGDGGFVTLPGFSLRLLAGPLQPPFENLADVLRVELDGESLLDQLGDTFSGPELGFPATGLGSLLQQHLKFLELFSGEAWLGAEVGLGHELPGSQLGKFDPGVDGGASTAEKVGNIVGRFPLLDEFNGTDTATLEFFGGSNGSHNTFNTSQTASRFNWLGWSQ